MTQPIGLPLPNWKGAHQVPRTPLEGRYCRLVPLDSAAHTADLFAAHLLDAEGRNWTYMSTPPPPDLETYRLHLAEQERSNDPLFFSVLVDDHALGIASFLRLDPKEGVVEVGHIHFSPLLQRTRAATEAMYLMMRRIFAELGYRRYEWKCDALNAPSRAAAERLGFQYEGTFRQSRVYKGRNRDTAWFSILDSEWPARQTRFERWLEPDNFDAAGQQKSKL